MRFYFLPFLLMVGGYSATAQTEMTQSTRDLFTQTFFRASNYDITPMSTMDGPAGIVLGHPYLDTAFVKATVTFYQNVAKPDNRPVYLIRDAPVRYNLHTNLIEFLVDHKSVKAIDGLLVKEVRWEKEGKPVVFLNVKEAGATPDQRGFVEQVADGNLKLFLWHRLYVKRPNYNPALSVGTKNTEILKEADYFISDGKSLTKFSPSRKAVMAIMQPKEDKISAYFKEFKPDLKSRRDLAALFSYYNSL